MMTSCAPLPPIPFVTDADLAAPVVTDLRLVSPVELEVAFDEAVSVVSEPLGSASVGKVTLRTAETPAPAVGFLFEAAPSPAAEHHVEAQVADVAGNHLRFVARFHGLNPMVPAMIINELTTQGSGNHPDLVEIRVLTDGNLAGACLYEGVPENWDQRYIFPSVDVVAGDYLVVHFKPEGIPEEIDEVDSRDASGGLDATPDGWDFWVPDGSGLSGNNGTIVLTENPLGGYIDAVLYSNRTSASDENYRGFGRRDVMERADALAAAGAWNFSGEAIAPEDAVDPDPSTGTRSMARGSDGADTNSRSDWHITPMRGLTPGTENTDEVYEP
ncbi:MAG: hypothetical protein ACOC2D_13380 [Spirochaetota bacterium]